MRITSLAVMAAALAASGAAYPVQAELHNTAWRPAVEPETCTEVPGEGSAAVTIRDADQLQRVLSNIEQLNVLAGWPDGVGLAVELPGVTEADLQLAAMAAAERESAPPAAGEDTAPPAAGDEAPATAPAKSAKKK